MKTQGWYKVIKDEEYFKEFLGIFSEFHDYRITHIEYDFEKNHLMLYLRYDTDEEGAVLKFINVLVSKGKSNLIPEKDNLYGQFVGEWDFEWVDNQGTTGERHVQGEWIFAWVLEGTAIQDVFICPSRKARIKDYQPDAAYATAVRMYNPNTEAWDILYTELGGATQLEGKREGNRIVQTEINEKNIQWVFSEITTTSFRWQRMVKRPDGTWETEAELFAVRR